MTQKRSRSLKDRILSNKKNLFLFIFILVLLYLYLMSLGVFPNKHDPQENGKNTKSSKTGSDGKGKGGNSDGDKDGDSIEGLRKSVKNRLKSLDAQLKKESEASKKRIKAFDGQLAEQIKILRMKNTSSQSASQIEKQLNKKMELLSFEEMFKKEEEKRKARIKKIKEEFKEVDKKYIYTPPNKKEFKSSEPINNKNERLIPTPTYRNFKLRRTKPVARKTIIPTPSPMPTKYVSPGDSDKPPSKVDDSILPNF